MKIIPRDRTEKYTLPLSIYKSIHLADAICREGKEFDVLIGLNKEQVAQLRQLSADESDTALQDFTGDWQRFVEGTYQDWYQKSRTILALVHKQSDDLAAVVWFGPKPLGEKSPKFGGSDGQKRDSDWHTVSFRAYPKYRGKGIMKNFTQFAMDTYKKHFPHIKFWAGLDDRNNASQRLLLSLGFKVNEEYSDLPAHWLIITKV